MKVRLTKMSDNKNALRTSEVEGELVSPIEVGKSLVILGNPLSQGMHVRQVSTSMVQEFTSTKPRVYEVKTLNSLYKLELLEVLQ